MENDIVYGLSEISLYLSNIGKYDFAQTIEDACKRLELLKEQEAKIEQLNRFINGFSRDAMPVVRCKDCKYLIDHYGFMDDGYCRKMREEYYVKFKPDKNWFCADGERQ